MKTCIVFLYTLTCVLYASAQIESKQNKPDTISAARLELNDTLLSKANDLRKKLAEYEQRELGHKIIIDSIHYLSMALRTEKNDAVKANQGLKGLVSKLRLDSAKLYDEFLKLQIEQNRQAREFAANDKVKTAILTRVDSALQVAKQKNSELIVTLDDSDKKIQKLMRTQKIEREKLEESIEVMESVNMDLQEEYQRHKSEKDSLTARTNRLKAIEARLSDADKDYKVIILWALGLFLSGLGVLAIVSLTARRLTAIEQEKVNHTSNEIISDVLRDYYQLSRLLELLRGLLRYVVGITVLFLLIILVIFARADSLELKDLINKGVWELIAAVAAPLVFIFTLYANTESKKNDLSKLLAERNQSSKIP